MSIDGTGEDTALREYVVSSELCSMDLHRVMSDVPGSELQPAGLRLPGTRVNEELWFNVTE